MKIVDRLVIHCGEDSTTFLLKPGKSSWVFGTEGDIQIGVDPQHARLDRERSDRFTITDLGSSVPTLLDNVSLLSNVPDHFSPAMSLSVGGCDVRLELNVQIEDDPVDDPEGPTDEPEHDPVDPQGDAAVQMRLSDAKLSVTPGTPIRFVVFLTNTGTIVEHYHLAFEGIPDGWLTVQPERLQLNPDSSGQMTVQINPPRTADSAAGTRPIALKVTGGNSSTVLGETSAQLNVEPFDSFATDLHPLRIQNSGSVNVSVENMGNQPQTYHFTARDSDDAVRFLPAETDVTVLPGEKKIQPFEVAPLSRPWFGSPRQYQLEFNIRAPSNESRQQNGTLVNNARLPFWVIPLLIIGSLALLGLIGVLLFGGDDNDEPEIVTDPTATDTPGFEFPTLAEISQSWTMDGGNASRSSWQSEAEFGTNFSDIVLESRWSGRTHNLSPSSIVFDNDQIYLAGEHTIWREGTQPTLDRDIFNDNVPMIDNSVSEILRSPILRTDIFIDPVFTSAIAPLGARGRIGAVTQDNLANNNGLTWVVDQGDLYEYNPRSSLYIAMNHPRFVAGENGVVTVFDGTNNFYQISPSSIADQIDMNSQIGWTSTTNFTPSIAITNGILSFCDGLTCGGYDVDARTGWVLQGSSPNNNPTTHAAVGNVVLGTFENRIIAIDARTGELLWKSHRETGQNIVTNNKYVFTVGRDAAGKSVLGAYDIRACIDSGNETCVAAWEKLFSATGSAPLAVTADYLFVGTPARILMVNPENGDILDTVALTTPIQPDSFTHLAVARDVLFGVVEVQDGGSRVSIIHAFAFGNDGLRKIGHIFTYYPGGSRGQFTPYTVLDVAIANDLLYTVDSGGIAIYKLGNLEAPVRE